MGAIWTDPRRTLAGWCSLTSAGPTVARWLRASWTAGWAWPG